MAEALVTGPGLAASSDGTVYTSEGYSLRKLASSGCLEARWGRLGCGPLAFSAVSDVALDGQSTLYILDAGNKTIQKVSTSG